MRRTNNEAIAQYLQRKKEEEKKRQREIPMFEVKLTKPLSDISPLLLRQSPGVYSNSIELKYDIEGDKTIAERLPQMKKASELKVKDVEVEFKSKNEVVIYLKASAIKGNADVKVEEGEENTKENEKTDQVLVVFHFENTLAKLGHSWNIEGGILSMTVKKLLPREWTCILKNRLPLKVEDEDEKNPEVAPKVVVDKSNTQLFSNEVTEGLRVYLEKALYKFKQSKIEYLGNHEEEIEKVAQDTFEEQLKYIEKLNEERRKKNETSEDPEEDEVAAEENADDNVDDLLEATLQEMNNEDENQPSEDEKLKKAEVKMQSTEAPRNNDIYELYIKSLEETLPEHPTRDQLAAIYCEQSTVLLSNHERKRSVELLELAAKLGNEQAILQMAQLCSGSNSHGRMYGIQPNNEKSMEYYYTAAFKFNNASALSFIGNLHTQVLKAPKSGNVFYAVCVIDGNTNSMFQLANNLYTNKPTDEDVKYASNLWEMAFTRGHYRSGITLGNLHSKLYNDMDTGVKFYQISCHLNDKVKFPPHVREYYNNVLLEKENEQIESIESTLNEAFTSVSGSNASTASSASTTTTKKAPLKPLEPETPATSDVNEVFSGKQSTTKQQKGVQSKSQKKPKSKGRPIWFKLVEWGVQLSLLSSAMYIGYKFIGGSSEQAKESVDSGISTTRMVSRDISL